MCVMSLHLQDLCEIRPGCVKWLRLSLILYKPKIDMEARLEYSHKSGYLPEAGRAGWVWREAAGPGGTNPGGRN